MVWGGPRQLRRETKEILWSLCVLKIFKDQEVWFGAAGSGGYLKKRLAEYAPRKILFITGRSSFRISGAENFLQSQTGLKVRYRFSEFSPRLNVDDLPAGLKYFKKIRPDCIIAAGGGSVLDMAKLINFFGTTKEDPTAYFGEAKRPAIPRVGLVPCIAVPTTAGTGSEATTSAVLYANKMKYSVEHPGMIFPLAVLNPMLTASMTPYQTACSGMDALSQGVESYWAVGATAESLRYAEKAVRLAWRFLRRAVKKPDIESRSKMQEAAYWSGRAINISKTTAAHAFSYALSAHYGLPHGHAVAMFLPAVFLENANISKNDINSSRGTAYVRKRLKELCGLLGSENADTAVRRLRALLKNIGLSNQWILEKRLNPRHVSECAARGVNSQRLRNNPRFLDSKSIVQITRSIQL
jgi:alcohol dehydrogenase class IV